MSSQSHKIECKYWEPFNNFGKCNLNLYGGYPSVGVCKLCIERGENNPEFAKKLFDMKTVSHPEGVPLVSGCCDPPPQSEW